MNETPDRPNEYLPARRTRAAAASAMSDHFAKLAEPPASASRGFSWRIVWRAFRRHWWQAGLAWLVLSLGLGALAYYKVRPSYDGVSQIRIDNANFIVYSSQNATAQVDFGQYMETQVSNITSPPVIKAAFKSRPELASLPMVRGSAAPQNDVRNALVVGVVPHTSLIQVSMSSHDPAEPSQIVNAVVDAFLTLASEQYDGSNQKKIERLTDAYKVQKQKVESVRKEIESLHQTIGSADVERIKNRNVASLDRSRQLNEQLTNVEIMRISAEAKLDQLRREKPRSFDPQDDAAVQQAVTDEFYADPQVATLQLQREKAQAKLKETERRTRSPSDPARQRAEEQLAELDEKINEFWSKLAPRLRRQVLTQPGDGPSDRLLAETEAHLASLKTQEDKLTGRLETLRIEDKSSEGQVLQLEYRRRDLERTETVLDEIQKNLSQLEFDEKSPIARISKEFPAEPAQRPTHDRRKQLMAAAPCFSALLVICLLTLLEMQGGRVADPDELSSRVNLQVIGVVPPLPQVRTLAATFAEGQDQAQPPAPDPRAQRQLDEFVQSLDHLRVALCARRDPWGRDRHCMLITSACGSEGKTTLAAQLAERCVNAGLMTLLIDADLRNPTLSRMLDAPDSPGLINVLRGEVTAEDVVMVIGDAGGFHLLPAGNPRTDPSRLLAGDRLGKLLAQARESFDMIIVDAPPVLPVPDALTIGRWTDGAVLAVRYDTSRFPLVERAYRRLGHVGVPVIGAVVNGVRTSASYYGGYGYGYGSYGDTPGENGNGVSNPASPSDPAVDD